MTRSMIETARAIRQGETTAVAVLDQTLAGIAARDPSINAFTEVTQSRARAAAAEVDRRHAAGEALPPLAGVPFAVKNLFDIEGVTTLAGGHVNADAAPADRDATLVARLADAGGVLVGALNMDEHAYGFTTENTYYGPCRNPHDPTRIAGGSSGGSAAAVAAAMVPLTLGSDTNGSIRVPASLCGVFGLKPTFGRLPRTGSFPFVASLDHLGPFARSAEDLSLAYDLMQGPLTQDAACAQREAEPSFAGLDRPPGGARIAVLGGYFHANADEAARHSVALAAGALGAVDTIELADVAQARAAAFIITAAQGGALHRQNLQARYEQYEPLSRDRLIAGSLVPADWVVQAQRVRHRFAEQLRAVFERYDLLLAPATPMAAVPIGTHTISLNGQDVPARASMGMLTQPFSCIGLPVCAAPVWPGIGPNAHLPIGVQLIAAPWREAHCLAGAHALQQSGVAHVREVA